MRRLAYLQERAASPQQKIELWRTPDEHGGDWAIWYGPGGADGDDATLVRHSGGGREGSENFDVYEVHNATGEIEDIDPDSPFLVQSTFVEVPSQGTMLKTMRAAAGIGVEQLSQHGGTEDWWDSLTGGF
jgi:hypothetical protein